MIYKDNFDILFIMSDPKVIQDNVKNIRLLIQQHPDLLTNDSEQFDELVKEKHSDFLELYPTIYQKLKDNTLDEEKLQYMLDMLTDVNNSTVTEFDASVKVGQKLVDHYVTPTLKK